MNLDFTYIFKVFPTIFSALSLTLRLAIIALAISFALAIVFAIARYYKIPVINQILKIYISFFRGTPPITQIMLIYFGVFGLNKFLIGLPASYAAVTSLSLNAAAYMSETIRGAFNAVDKGQIEACMSIGMTRIQTMRRIILPQSMTVALPSLLNSLVDLIKGTSLAFLIGVPELMAIASYEGSKSFKYFEIYVIVAVIYWCLSIILTRLQSLAEKKLNSYK